MEHRGNERLAEELSSEGGGQPILRVFDFFDEYVDSNLFLPCVKEIKRLGRFVSEQGGEMSLSEEEGEVRILLWNDQRFHVRLLFRLSLWYPFRLPTVEIQSGKRIRRKQAEGEGTYLLRPFPPYLSTLFAAQMEEVVRRMRQGVAGCPQDILDLTSSANLSYTSNSREEEEAKRSRRVEVTASTLHEMKSDLEDLKTMSSLRQQVQDNQIFNAHHTKLHVRNDPRLVKERSQLRRQARREMKKMKEMAIREEAEEKERARGGSRRGEGEKKKKKVSGGEGEEGEEGEEDLSDLDFSRDPLPSMFTCTQFVVSQVLPVVTFSCPHCHEPFFPPDRELSSSELESKEHKAHRLFCGHYYHDKVRTYVPVCACALDLSFPFFLLS